MKGAGGWPIEAPYSTFKLGRLISATISMEYLQRSSPPASESRNTCCYVLNLPQCIDERFLSHIMSSYGDIESVKVVPNSPTHSTSVGFVNMKSSSEAQTAVRALQGASTETGTLELVAGPPVGSKSLTPSRLPQQTDFTSRHHMKPVVNSLIPCRLVSHVRKLWWCNG